jgi:hypothetical protein
MIQLISRDGSLYYPPNPRREWRPDEPLILVHRYPAGDCDTIAWPLRSKDRENLPRCLFDDRECGLIQDEEVLLPDGSSAWSAAAFIPARDVIPF